MGLRELPDPPGTTATGPVHAAFSSPALLAHSCSDLDSLPFGWGTSGRRQTFASYHCCTLILERAQHFTFLTSALLTFINRPLLGLSLTREAGDDSCNAVSIISDRPPAISPF